MGLHLHHSVIICFVKSDLPDCEINLPQPLAPSELPNEAVFFFSASSHRVGRFFKQFAERAAKRERGHAPHASNREQARRIRHSTSLLAPKARPRTAARAPLYVNSTNGRVGCHDEERWC